MGFLGLVAAWRYKSEVRKVENAKKIIARLEKEKADEIARNNELAGRNRSLKNNNSNLSETIASLRNEIGGLKERYQNARTKPAQVIIKQSTEGRNNKECWRLNVLLDDKTVLVSTINAPDSLLEARDIAETLFANRHNTTFVLKKKPAISQEGEQDA